MCRVIQAQLPRSETSARQAARLVRATIEEWVPDVGPDLAEAAEQMTRALVTNAVVHALSPVRLVIALMGGVLEVGVSDTDVTLPGGRVPAPLAVGARSERDACVCAADAPGAVRLGSGASVVSAALAPGPT